MQHRGPSEIPTPAAFLPDGGKPDALFRRRWNTGTAADARPAYAGDFAGPARHGPAGGCRRERHRLSQEAMDERSYDSVREERWHLVTLPLLSGLPCLAHPRRVAPGFPCEDGRRTVYARWPTGPRHARCYTGVKLIAYFTERISVIGSMAISRFVAPQPSTIEPSCE